MSYLFVFLLIGRRYRIVTFRWLYPLSYRRDIGLLRRCLNILRLFLPLRSQKCLTFYEREERSAVPLLPQYLYRWDNSLLLPSRDLKYWTILRVKGKEYRVQYSLVHIEYCRYRLKFCIFYYLLRQSCLLPTIRFYRVLLYLRCWRFPGTPSGWKRDWLSVPVPPYVIGNGFTDSLLNNRKPVPCTP